MLIEADNTFAFDVERAHPDGFFRFRLKLGQLVTGGDTPDVMGSALYALEHLYRIDELPPVISASEVGRVYRRINRNDVWHDKALLSLTEEFDAWSMRGYLSGAFAVFIAVSTGRPVQSQAVSVPLDAYLSAVGALAEYIHARE